MVQMSEAAHRAVELVDFVRGSADFRAQCDRVYENLARGFVAWPHAHVATPVAFLEMIDAACLACPWGHSRGPFGEDVRLAAARDLAEAFITAIRQRRYGILGARAAEILRLGAVLPIDRAPIGFRPTTYEAYTETVGGGVPPTHAGRLLLDGEPYRQRIVSTDGPWPVFAKTYRAFFKSEIGGYFESISSMTHAEAWAWAPDYSSDLAKGEMESEDGA